MWPSPSDMAMVPILAIVFCVMYNQTAPTMGAVLLGYRGLTLNTLRLRQSGRHFADDIFKRIFFNENVWILIKISLKFVPKGPINKIPTLFQIMARRRPGDKPLSEAMLVSLLTHKCVTRPQWVNTLRLRQNGCQFPDNIFKCIFLNENIYKKILTLNTLRLRQSGRHFADDIFKRIFFSENVWILIKISLKFVPKGPINNIPSLVQMMACPGDKPLSEPMMVSLLTNIGITQPQWVNKQLAHFFSKYYFIFKYCSLQIWYFCMTLVNISQHCGYWWPGALAPGHQ